MSKYQELIQNPPSILKDIVENPREVIFYVVSCMCDNKYTLRFRKNDDGDFKMSGMGFALSNFQFKHKVFEIEWEADNGNWLDVKNMINSGTEKIEKVISR
tara:strand:- start:1 stop:303 length:303 start_codon:yes stop_codon:yes gene_type:complete